MTATGIASPAEHHGARLQRGNATQRMFHRRNLRPPTLPNSSLHRSGSRDGRQPQEEISLDETLEIVELHHLGFHGQTAMWGEQSSTRQKCCGSLQMSN